MIIKRDGLFKVICNIRTPIKSGKEEIGTGIFFFKQHQQYILTASHVVKNANDQTYIIVSDKSNNPHSIPISSLSNGNTWVHHSNADLAYIKIVSSQAIENDIFDRGFPYGNFFTQKSSPSRDTELTAIGFPLGLGSKGHYSPLTFRTFASSSLITLNRADTKTPADFFVLENPSVGGYSGGPVFDIGYIENCFIVQEKDRTICYGIMHGTLADNTGGKLAVVTPASYLDGWL